MPSQNLVDASFDELSIFRRKCLRLNDLRHAHKRAQEMAAVMMLRDSHIYREYASAAR
ncbi:MULTISPECIES: hypothetical protein [Xanthomonas]|uniref:Uncharacterized protein n=3 Tax=Xanthomonas hortorum TaxID=56454 RepID=A0AAW8ZWP4_9XANT|nr:MULTISPECIES: hypothetical protein [Xanthomonas]MCC3256502.1 hypothetical protein [Xanthomonas campestris pv. armoraciae]MCC8494450.1 hypothetical protein [Xanthomonas hortorum pv. gardneri]MCE4304693.1 hypothetical protein [Xanthomonas hortorum pv. vitians]MCE4373602.1 hypothetical protein [Xanthomonas hortorum pv. hederae]MCE4530526.1 hypothetical protein [Xanthomonas hortorum pv. vitians]